VRFWAFLGKGSSKTREKKLSTKKNTGEIIFRGEFFSGGIYLTPFPFGFVVALVKGLSVRGTQKCGKKSSAGRASIFFPPLPICF
jgi:hypothetical protein